MRYKELFERNFSDVGVRGGKMYLAAKVENLNPEFYSTGVLHGVKGISSSRDIWRQFGPNVSRNILFVMDADAVVRLNNVTRVGYDDAEKLVANNSRMIGRILSIKDVARSMGDNLIMGCFPKMKQFHDDPATVTNRAVMIADYLRKGQKPSEKYPNVDDSSFGDLSQGLRLSSIDDYGNLYYQAAKSAGYYGKQYAKFFAPQNRSKWYPAVAAGIVRQANVYADEAEWVTKDDDFTVPKGSTIILAVPKDYATGVKPENARFWSEHDDKRLAAWNEARKNLANSGYKVREVSAEKATNSLLAAQSRQTLRK